MITSKWCFSKKKMKVAMCGAFSLVKMVEQKLHVVAPRCPQTPLFKKKSAEVDGVSCLLLSLKKGCILAMLSRRGFREHISSKTEARKSMRCAATFLLLMLARYSKDAIDIIM
jgi:hypothetical protein